MKEVSWKVWKASAQSNIRHTCQAGRELTFDFPFVILSPSSTTMPPVILMTRRAFSPSRTACPAFFARIVMSLLISRTLVPFPV